MLRVLRQKARTFMSSCTSVQALFKSSSFGTACFSSSCCNKPPGFIRNLPCRRQLFYTPVRVGVDIAGLGTDWRRDPSEQVLWATTLFHRAGSCACQVAVDLSRSNRNKPPIVRVWKSASAFRKVLDSKPAKTHHDVSGVLKQSFSRRHGHLKFASVWKVAPATRPRIQSVL